MTVAVDVAVESGRLPVARAAVAALAEAVLRAERVRHALLSITFLPNRAMAKLNARHLGRRGATDVITFAFAPVGEARSAVIGDIYIAPAVARAHARAHGSGVRRELARLVVHGTLHAVGYDHPEGEERTASPMWSRQEQLLARCWRGG